MSSPKEDFTLKPKHEVLAHARTLVGQRLALLYGAEAEHKFRGKGSFGQLLEKLHFGYQPNPSPEMDFPVAKLELKSTGAIKKSKQWRAKERLVFSNINYVNLIHEENFATSSFVKKNANLLLVVYHWEREVNPIHSLIIGVGEVAIFELDERDVEIIKQDWLKIRQIIAEGNAHKLSEGHTTYLKATRKGAGHGLDNRPQPMSDVPAPNRAFSFPASFLTKLITPIIKKGKAKVKHAESLVADAESLKRLTFDEIVLNRFARFRGRTVESIQQEVDPDLNLKTKASFAILARRMLGVRTQKIEEFERAEIHMKTIRIGKNGRPKEDMSFPYFKYKEVAHQTWWESDFREALSKRFLFVFYREEGDTYIFDRAIFWGMPEDLLDTEVQQVWEETARRIRNGEADKLPAKSEHHITHVRPHARNKKDTDETPDGQHIVKKSFWLNAQFIQKIYEDELEN